MVREVTKFHPDDDPSKVFDTIQEAELAECDAYIQKVFRNNSIIYDGGAEWSDIKEELARDEKARSALTRILQDLTPPKSGRAPAKRGRFVKIEKTK